MKNPIVIISTVVVMALVGVTLYKSGVVIKKTEAKKYFGETILKFCVDKVCLTKNEGEWWVDDGTVRVPGETELIDGYTRKLEEIKLVEVVSQNPERFEGLGIGTTKTKTLMVGDKKMELGNLTNGSSGTFVRGNDVGLVYKIPVVLDGEVLAKRGFWEVKAVTNLPRAQVKKITITGGKKSKSWEIKDEKKISLACYLPIVKYLDKFDSKGSNVYKLEIEIDGTKNTLIVGAIGGRKVSYWATVDEKKYFEIKRESFYSLTGVVR